MPVSAHPGYAVAKWLMVTGLISLLATFPFVFIAWGKPSGMVLLVAAMYGMSAIFIATVLGLINLITLRRTNGCTNLDGVNE